MVDEGRLLIVADDDAMLRKLAEVWFSRMRFHVLMAGDDEEGLALARRVHPATIVSDALMPKMDGFTSCLEVRRDPDLAGIPVILTSSAYIEKADHDLAMRVGAHAFVPKVGGLEAVTRALMTALETPSRATPSELEEIERDHSRRARAQLDRQLLENRTLLLRSTMQQAQLAVLARSADALSRSVPLDSLILDALALTLDMAGVSKGALYLLKDGECELRCQVGFPDADIIQLKDKFGQASLVEKVATGGRIVALGSTTASEDVWQQLLIGIGVTSLLLVPVTTGLKTYGALLLGASTADVATEEAK